MTRILPALLLVSLLLVPSHIVAQDATPPSDALADPIAVIEAIDLSSAPSELPGNVDEEVTMETWEDHYGEELDGTLGAWVFTGSPDLPIALLMVFDSPENAQTGIATYAQEHNQDTVGELDVWTIPDRGKWLCVTADGPVVILGQAEPQPDESEDDVRQRSCQVVQAMHTWLIDQLTADATVATPPATPGA